MKPNHKIASFDDTFGENKGNDAFFFLDDDIVAPKKQQEGNITMTAKDVINEVELLSSETLDKDSIGKNLNRVIDWFKSNEIEEEFLNELPEKLDALLANLEDQVNELDATATSLLKIALKKINEVDIMRDHYKSFEREHWLNGLVQARWKEFKDKLEEKSKKIKKEKREKFFAAAAEKKKKNNNKGKITKRERNWQKGEASLHKKKE